MNMLAAAHIKNINRALGHTWKKILVLMVLGVALGVIFALAIPLRVS